MLKSVQAITVHFQWQHMGGVKAFKQQKEKEAKSRVVDTYPSKK